MKCGLQQQQKLRPAQIFSCCSQSRLLGLCSWSETPPAAQPPQNPVSFQGNSDVHTSMFQLRGSYESIRLSFFAFPSSSLFLLKASISVTPKYVCAALSLSNSGGQDFDVVRGLRSIWRRTEGKGQVRQKLLGSHCEEEERTTYSHSRGLLQVEAPRRLFGDSSPRTSSFWQSSEGVWPGPGSSSYSDESDHPKTWRRPRVVLLPPEGATGREGGRGKE